MGLASFNRMRKEAAEKAKQAEQAKPADDPKPKRQVKTETKAG